MSEQRKRGKKRPKSYYLKCSNPKKKKLNKLDVGMKGYLITCNNNNEKQAVRESYNILNEYADELYGPEVSTKADEEEDSDEDIDTAMKKEIDEIKQIQTNERRFQNIEANAKNCIFIRTTLPDPTELSNKIFNDLYSTKTQKTRFALKMVPIIGTCRAQIDEISKLAKSILIPYFTSCDEKVPNYQIIFKSRNNGSISKENVYSAVGHIVKEMSPSSTVCFDNTDIVILVEIITNVCGMGVVRDFFKFRKCNLIEMAKPNENDSTKKCEEKCEKDNLQLEKSTVSGGKSVLDLTMPETMKSSDGHIEDSEGGKISEMAKNTEHPKEGTMEGSDKKTEMEKSIEPSAAKCAVDGNDISDITETGSPDLDKHVENEILCSEKDSKSEHEPDECTPDSEDVAVVAD